MMSPHPAARRRNGDSAMIAVSMITAIGVWAARLTLSPSFWIDARDETTPSWLDAEGEVERPLADLLLRLADLRHRRVGNQIDRRLDLARAELLLDDRAGDLHRRLVGDNQGALPELERLTHLADLMDRVVAHHDVSRQLHRFRFRERLYVHRRHAGAPNAVERGVST